MLIFCSITSDYYYQCWKRTVLIWNRNLCMIINGFTVTWSIEFILAERKKVYKNAMLVLLVCQQLMVLNDGPTFIQMKHTRPIHVISQQTSCARAQRKLYNVMQWMFMVWPCSSCFVWEICFYSDAWCKLHELCLRVTMNTRLIKDLRFLQRHQLIWIHTQKNIIIE